MSLHNDSALCISHEERAEHEFDGLLSAEEHDETGTLGK
jgi:hypothetical protein